MSGYPVRGYRTAAARTASGFQGLPSAANENLRGGIRGAANFNSTGLGVPGNTMQGFHGVDSRSFLERKWGQLPKPMPAIPLRQRVPVPAPLPMQGIPRASAGLAKTALGGLRMAHPALGALALGLAALDAWDTAAKYWEQFPGMRINTAGKFKWYTCPIQHGGSPMVHFWCAESLCPPSRVFLGAGPQAWQPVPDGFSIGRYDGRTVSGHWSRLVEGWWSYPPSGKPVIPGSLPAPAVQPVVYPHAPPNWLPQIDPLSHPPLAPQPRPHPRPRTLPRGRPNPYRSPVERTHWGPLPRFRTDPRVRVRLDPRVRTDRRTDRRVPTRPLPWSPRQPPGPQTKERKAKLSAIAAGLLGGAYAATEFRDAIREVWRALPPQYRTPGADVTTMANEVYTNFDKVVIADAITNLVANHLEDKFLGGLHRLGNRARQRLNLTGLGLAIP